MSDFALRNIFWERIYQRLLAKQISVDLEAREERYLQHGQFRKFLQGHNIVDLIHFWEKNIKEIIESLEERDSGFISNHPLSNLPEDTEAKKLTHERTRF